MPTATFNFTGSNQTFTFPLNGINAQCDVQGAAYTTGATVGKGARVQILASVFLLLTPGATYDMVVGGTAASATGGYSDGANGGAAGVGGAGFGGGGMSYITPTGSGKAGALICAGAAGGAHGGAATGGATSTTLDTQATGANAPSNGSTGGLGSGGGGGGGGWRGGGGGTSSNNGGAGTSMYRTTAVSGGTPTVTAEFQNTNGLIVITYSLSAASAFIGWGTSI